MKDKDYKNLSDEDIKTLERLLLGKPRAPEETLRNIIEAENLPKTTKTETNSLYSPKKIEDQTELGYIDQEKRANSKKARSERALFRKQAANGLALGAQIAFTIIICIALSIFLGVWLDNRLGTSPVFLLIFIFVGIAAAFKAMYDLINYSQL